MGGLEETDKIIKHREQCPVCKPAGDYNPQAYCDEWSDMYNNFIDWQCAEGPFETEDSEGLMMCPRCDGSVDGDNYCRACQRTMICDCPSDQACDICDPYGMWRKGRADIDKRLLRLLMTSPMRTIQMAMALGIPEDEVRWRMRRLQELGLVAYAGPEGT